MTHEPPINFEQPRVAPGLASLTRSGAPPARGAFISSVDFPSGFAKYKTQRPSGLVCAPSAPPAIPVNNPSVGTAQDGGVTMGRALSEPIDWWNISHLPFLSDVNRTCNTSTQVVVIA